MNAYLMRNTVYDDDDEFGSGGGRGVAGGKITKQDVNSGNIVLDLKSDM